jgi:hypothetical protein
MEPNQKNPSSPGRHAVSLAVEGRQRSLKIYDCRPTPKTLLDQDCGKHTTCGRLDAADIAVSCYLDGHGHH